VSPDPSDDTTGRRPSDRTTSASVRRGDRPTPRAGSQPDPLTDRHVLVVGINYAPEPTGTGPYTTALAEHLATRAGSVDVLTGLPHHLTRRVPEQYRGRRQIAEPRRHGSGPDVTRLWHYVPRRTSWPARLTRFARLAPLSPIAGIAGIASEITFGVSTLLARRNRRPDVVVGVIPALGGALAAARLARRHRARLLVVVHGLNPRAGRAEGFVLRRADRVIVTDETFRDAVRRHGVADERISLLPHWTHLTAPAPGREESRARLGWDPDRFVVAHTGAMGRTEDLETVVEAARLLPPGIDVRLIGDGSQRRLLAEQSATLTNVQIDGPLDDATQPFALAAADLLLVNERPSIADVAPPSDLMAYLGAGRPILAAVAVDGAAAAELYRTKGAALIVRPGDPGLLARSIIELRRDATLRAAMGRVGRRYAHARMDRAASMLTFDEIIDGLIVGTGRGKPLT
jgi:colanic acid biosynthesis glycosyl transferase WcaI